MIAPVGRLTKQEIVWLSRHRCSHAHTYLEHYSCYLNDNPMDEKIGFFDIETTGFQAPFSLMLCYVVKEAGKGKPLLFDCIKKKDIHSPTLDRNVVASCVKDISKFDKLVTYYGTGFDLTWTRTKALMYDIPFPAYGEINHKDVYYLIKSKFKLHSNRLEAACTVLLGKTRKSSINPWIWQGAMAGKQSSYDFILDHCKKDVLDLEDLYNLVLKYHAPGKRSI